MPKITNILLLFVAMLVGATGYGQSRNTNSPPHEQSGPPDSKFGGIQIERSQVFKMLTATDSTIHFTEKQGNESGQVFVATGVNNSHYEVTGTEFYLQKITAEMHLIAGDKEANSIGYLRLAFLIKNVTPLKEEATIWMRKQLVTFSKNPSVSFVDKAIINADKFTWAYESSNATILLTISTN
jgi:hypothetical protein